MTMYCRVLQRRCVPATRLAFGFEGVDSHRRRVDGVIGRPVCLLMIIYSTGHSRVVLNKHTSPEHDHYTHLLYISIHKLSVFVIYT
jgi:hypothetical protein